MAGKIPQSFIDDLIERTDIVEIVDARVRLKKTGSNYSARCPFHQEKTPSFSVNPDKQFYYCFGCGAGGNVISFLMDFERTDFIETVENLAHHQGLTIPREDNPQQEKAQQTKRTLYDLLENVSTFYQQQLRQHPQKQKAVNYLQQRGLSGEICKRFGIGFAPPGWDNLIKALGNNSEQLHLLEESGMLVQREDKSGQYDRFRDRIMFPIRDNRGRVIAFGGRVLNDEKPKYLNSPETPVFHKQQELYGLWEARQANRHLQRLIMVEGYMDVVALAQFGISNAVATLGTAAGSTHMEKVFRHTSEVVFCFDGDNAGRKAAERALEAVLPLMEAGRQARFFFLPEGEDPDSFVRKVGEEQFHWHLSKAASLSEHLFAICSEGLQLNKPDDKAQLLTRLTPHLKALPDSAFKVLLLQDLSEKTGLTSEKIQQLLAPTEPEALASTHPQQSHTHHTANHGEPRKAPMQRQKLPSEERHIKRTPPKAASAILLFNPQFARLTPVLDGSENDNHDYQLLRQLQDYVLQHPDTQASAMLGHWLHKENAAITKLLQLAMESDGEEQLQQEYVDAISRIRELHAKWQARQTINLFKPKTPHELSSSEREAFANLFNPNTKPEQH